jgi:hypothetical protein
VIQIGLALSCPREGTLCVALSAHKRCSDRRTRRDRRRRGFQWDGKHIGTIFRRASRLGLLSADHDQVLRCDLITARDVVRRHGNRGVARTTENFGSLRNSIPAATNVWTARHCRRVVNRKLTLSRPRRTTEAVGRRPLLQKTPRWGLLATSFAPSNAHWQR